MIRKIWGAQRRHLFMATASALVLVASAASAGTVSYTYDELGRLKTASYSGGATITYSYDAAGNRTQLIVSDSNTAWTPFDLGSKLKAWWSAPVAGDNITLNGSAVASWVDEVSGYALSQATGSNQPIYSTTGFNGFSDAEFDGSNDSLVLEGVPSSIPTGSTPSEIWAQARSDALSGETTTDVLFDMGGTASGDPNRRNLARLSGNVAAAGYDGVSPPLTNSVVLTEGYHVWRGVYNSTSGRLDMDATQGSTTTGLTPTTGTARARMGGSTYSTSQGPWKGSIRQILITEPLTNEEADLMYAYLNGGGGDTSPAAVDDSISTTLSTPKTFDPRTNDTDPHGDPLTITNTTNGVHGTVSINAGASLTYTPNVGYAGSDTFTYTISNGQGGTDTATVTVMNTAWTPLDLGSKLKAWWAGPVAGDNITLNGSAVASWVDEVGGYALSQATGSNQPIYSTTDFNGFSDAEFDGSNDSLVLEGVPSSIPTESTPSEIWAQARSDALSGETTTDVLFDMGGTASGDPDRRSLARLDSNVAAAGYDGLSPPLENSVSTDGYHVWRGVYGATSGRLDMDATQGSTTTGLTPTTGTARIRMGGSNYSTSQGPWKGSIRQILITEPLTNEEADLMYAYLNGGGSP